MTRPRPFQQRLPLVLSLCPEDKDSAVAPPSVSPPHGRLGERGLTGVLLLPDPFFGQRYVHILGRRKLYHVVKYTGGSAELLFFVEGLRFPDEGFSGLVSIHVSLLEYMAEVGASAGRDSGGRRGFPWRKSRFGDLMLPPPARIRQGLRAPPWGSSSLYLFPRMLFGCSSDLTPVPRSACSLESMCVCL